MPDVYPILNYLELPTGANGADETYEIQDAGARSLISALGDAVYWAGVTTTELVDNVTTTDTITVGGQSVEVHIGAMAQYNGEEFVYNGEKWQSIGKNNFGALAFKDSATGSVSGNVTVTPGTDTTASVTPLGSAGTAPSWSYNSSSKKATFSAGSAATAGTAVTVVTASGTPTATFSSSVTVS